MDRPGDHPVPNAPVHHGQISLGMSTPSAPVTVGRWWQFTLDEYNGTGAAYQHVAVGFGLFGWTGVSATRLDGMTPKNTHVQAMLGGVWKDVPLAGGCDPSMGVNSTLLDHPLAAGARWSVPVRIKIDTTVVPQLKSFNMIDADEADGTEQVLDHQLTVDLVRAAAQPSASASASASPSASASATPSAAAPGTPAPTASGQSVNTAPVAHATARGTNGTYLGIGAALLVAAGLVGLVAFRKRRGSRA